MAGRLPAGVHASVVDGNRKLRLSVDPGRTLVVLGDAGEPSLRFSSRGVEANVRCATAYADRVLTPAKGTTLELSGPPVWKRASDGRSLAWHEHRLAPATDAARTGQVGTWSVPVVLDGRRTAVGGGVWRAPAPALWPWLLVAALFVALAAGGIALRRPNLVRNEAVGLGLLAASGALAATIGYELAGPSTGRRSSGEVVAALALAAIATGLVAFARGGTRMFVAGLVAAAALYQGIVLAGVLGHSFVISTLPATAARAAVEPDGPVTAGKPVAVSFTIDQPSGEPLTRYKTDPGPHVGIHLIMVRSDLGAIIHLHPPVGAGGVLRTTATFPTPGRYRVIVDAYPMTSVSLTNFQLFSWITVAGRHAPEPLPPPGRSLAVDGYRFTISSAAGSLKAIEPAFLTVHVTGPDGRPATFTPWFGALAHAIFMRTGTLDYFHTHVCAAGVSGCTSVLGAARVTGVSSTPGLLKVGVLLPLAGTWRLFLQCDADGKVVTAPFTLMVR